MCDYVSISIAWAVSTIIVSTIIEESYSVTLLTWWLYNCHTNWTKAWQTSCKSQIGIKKTQYECIARIAHKSKYMHINMYVRSFQNTHKIISPRQMLMQMWWILYKLSKERPFMWRRELGCKYCKKKKKVAQVFCTKKKDQSLVQPMCFEWVWWIKMGWTISLSQLTSEWIIRSMRKSTSKR